MTIYLLTRLGELPWSLESECAKEACYQSHHVAKRGKWRKCVEWEIIKRAKEGVGDGGDPRCFTRFDFSLSLSLSSLRMMKNGRMKFFGRSSNRRRNAGWDAAESITHPSWTAASLWLSFRIPRRGSKSLCLSGHWTLLLSKNAATSLTIPMKQLWYMLETDQISWIQLKLSHFYQLHFFGLMA